MTPSARPTRHLLVLALAVLCAAACGSTESTDKAADAGGSGAESLVREANEVMRTTAFRASGPTTVVRGGVQRTSWDPDKGLRIVTSGTAEGEMYCKDGMSYLSASLLAASLNDSGQDVRVPEDLADAYVSTETGGRCDALFRISESAERLPEKDTEVDGTPAKAVTVGDSRTEDVYYIAASGTPYLLKRESARDGRNSPTMYEDFGGSQDIAMPPSERIVPMDEFQQGIAAG